MAEPLKNQFGRDVVESIATMIDAVHPTFDRTAFVAACLDGFDDLELTPRARHISDALALHLPADRGVALQILLDALAAEPPDDEPTGMTGFRHLPLVFFAADHGLDHFETAMALQYELTKRFTAEFSIRAFLEHHPERTLARLRVWAEDPDLHVRRLVSEGTRPRLPWATRLRRFQDDPTPVLGLLEMLKDDPEEYVRRSVANNLNDIAKDHPERVLAVAERWWAAGDETRHRLIRHALRTLVKEGDPRALAVLGYDAASPIEITSVSIEPRRVPIGDRVHLRVVLSNPAGSEVGALVDLRIHFVKANGKAGPKVFKGAEVAIDPGASATVKKSVSLARHSTRTPHPGRHDVDVLINGIVHPVGSFEVTG